jgi:hypothetical protein
VGAAWEVAAVLKSRFAVEEQGTGPPPRVWRLWLKGLAARALYVLRSWWHWLAIRRYCQLPAGPFEVVFSGFWDWSVAWNDVTRSLATGILKASPEARRGFPGDGCLVAPWNHKQGGLCGGAGSLRVQGVVILQAFLRPGWKSAWDFGPGDFLTIRKQLAFQDLFRRAV